MDKLFRISLYTITDQMRHKSFYVLLGIAILFVLLIRGCYNADFSVNGKSVDSVTLAWHASKIVFHIIAFGMHLMTALIAMRIFTHDFTDGSTILFLSRPAERWHYVIGRLVGTWILVSLFQFILHTTIFSLAWIKTGGMIPGYLSASLVCSFSLLFTLCLVTLLSLKLPDFIAALATMGILFVGFISEGGHQLMQNNLVKTALADQAIQEPALWRVLYPKVYLLQNYAVTIIDKSEFIGMGPIHPLINVLGYAGICAGLLVFVFNKKEL